MRLLDKRQELTLFANKLVFGWKTVEEYTQHEFPEDEQDVKKIGYTEERAEKALKENWRPKNNRPCTTMLSIFFLAYPSFFHLKKFFYSDFGPSALRLRMEESAVIFAAYDV